MTEEEIRELEKIAMISARSGYAEVNQGGALLAIAAALQRYVALQERFANDTRE